MKCRQFFDNELVFSIWSLNNRSFVFGTLVSEFFILTSVSNKLAAMSLASLLGPFMASVGLGCAGPIEWLI